MLATSRPDLLDRRPDWCEQDCCTRLRLHPLTGEQSVLVAENALGALDESTRRVVADAAEGNPLFVEQMLSMLIDNGLLVRRDGRWTPARSLAAIEVPPTIHALVAARIDRLPAAERSALEPAAVIGRVFYREAIEGLDGGAPADVDRRLGALIRKEYIEPERSTLVMGDSFQFVHGLIQDAAYRGLLKRRRADLHEAFAGWVLEIVGDRLAEYEEIVGHHLEHAGRYLAELGTADDRTRALGRRAAELLGSAGRRALARGDMSAAAGLLRRAREALAADDPGRLGLVFDLTEVLVEQGEFAEAELLLDESAALSAAGGDVLRETEVRLARLVVSFAVAPASWGDDARHEIEQAISTFSRIGHEVGIAKGWRLLGTVHGARCRYAEAEHAVEQTILHARAAGDALLELRNHAPYAFIALAGPMPVPHAIERCRSLIEDVHGDRRTEGVILCALSQLEAMRGGFDEARAGYRRARQVLAELGVRVLAASVSLNAGPVEMLAGDPAAAERELRRDALALEAMGERYLFPCVVAFLSHAVLEQGRLEEAGELALRCADLSAPDDIEAQNLWRRVWARVLASTGRGDEAERFATAAIEFAERTDSPVMQADSLADLAAVLLLQGRRDAADEASAAAVALYRAKGSTVAADRLRARAAAKPG